MKTALTVQQVFTVRAVYLALDEVLKHEVWEERFSKLFHDFVKQSPMVYKVLHSHENGWVYTNMFRTCRLSKKLMIEAIVYTLKHLEEMKESLHYFSMIDYDFFTSLTAEKTYELMNEYEELF